MRAPAGFKVGAWTVNEPDEMKSLIGLELDAICTDRPIFYKPSNSAVER